MLPEETIQNTRDHRLRRTSEQAGGATTLCLLLRGRLRRTCLLRSATLLTVLSRRLGSWLLGYERFATEVS